MPQVASDACHLKRLPIEKTFELLFVWFNCERTPELPFDVMTYTPTARPGHRAPHAWLKDGRSTLDLFGHGFTLLCFDEGMDIAPLIEAASARNVPLKTEIVDDAAVAALYETRLVLVRPDGHVAWRGDDPPKDVGAVIETVIGV